MMECRTEIGRFSVAEWRQQQRERERAEVKAEAALCDCWRQSGPICAKCKLRQALKVAK